jgi:hypothetical protein
MEEIIYNSLTYIIVLFAIFIAVRKVVLKNTKKEESSCADGCGGCSSKCDLKALVKNTKA